MSPKGRWTGIPATEMPTCGTHMPTYGTLRGGGAQRNCFTVVTVGLQEETILKLNLQRQRELSLNREGSKDIGARETINCRGH